MIFDKNEEGLIFKNPPFQKIRIIKVCKIKDCKIQKIKDFRDLRIQKPSDFKSRKMKLPKIKDTQNNDPKIKAKQYKGLKNKKAPK